MNSILKSSTLVPLNRQSASSLQTSSLQPSQSSQSSQPSLALINSNSQLERPNQQQKKAIAQIYVEQAWIYFQDR
ncbi:MAG: hypothetical protein AAFQ14_20290, partial [Cyanobacteria bacterium J06621_12]